MPEDFLIARNPDPGSSLPYLLRVPLGDDGILLKAKDTWPRTAKVYCHRAEEWPAEPELVERVPVRSGVRRGAAIDLVLDAYEEAQRRWPRPDVRHRIEHFGVSRPDQVARCARLGVVPVPQGRFVGEIGDGMLRALGPQLQALLYVSEIRSIRADALWLSGAYGRDTIGIHFTWRLDEPAVRALVFMIEAALAPFDARPHWGKVFTSDPVTIASRYPRWADFIDLRERWDPRGVFRNAQLAAWGM